MAEPSTAPLSRVNGGRISRVLLVDNQEIARRDLRAMLERDSEVTICAEASGEREGVELATLHRPDIAVVALVLPILDGIEITRQIRRGSPATKVLIFTIHDDEMLITDALQAGAHGYLLKSEPHQMILETITILARLAGTPQ
jgi:DNA-binding NarL/FixJ family response regulator